MGEASVPRAARGCWDKQEWLSLLLFVSGRQAGTETLRRFFVYNSSAEESIVSETMRGIVFQGEGRWALEARPMPSLASDDDVLLKIDSASICGTDLHILSVPPGHPATPGSILGHEYVATVEEAGSAANGIGAGDRVVIDPNLTCGLCQSCRTGKTNCCENMTTLGIFRNGGLAEFNVAPAKALHKINRDVPPEQAALAEPLTCVLHAFEKVSITPGESVVVIGAGPIGLLFSMLYKSAGAGMTIIIEPVDYRRRVAEACGADTALDPTAGDSTEAIRSATRGGADVVIDAAGKFFQQALDVARARRPRDFIRDGSAGRMQREAIRHNAK